MRNYNWFGSRNPGASGQPIRLPKRAIDRRRAARQLLIEGLEGRNLLAFDVLAEYATGVSPQALVLTQIDAGSQPDLVVANRGESIIGVWIGGSGGAFGGLKTATTGTAPLAVATGDFDGDFIPDLATANSADVSLLIGNGDGSFQSPTSTGLPDVLPLGASALTPQNPSSIATGDLNADGYLDLAVGASTTHIQKFGPYSGYYGGYYYNYWPVYNGYVNVLLGDGMGGFGAAETHHLGESRFPSAVAVGDIDGDTLNDVITANRSDLSVLLGDGSGAVGSPAQSGSGSGLRSISLGDVDGDGKIDTLLGGGWGLYVQKGDGLGGFSAQPFLATSKPVDSAVMGDVNSDGKLDLVAAGGSNSYTCTSHGYYGCYSGYWTSTRDATVILGNGSGGYAMPLTSTLSASSATSAMPGIAILDLSGDGLPDLVAIESVAGQAIVAINDGDWNPPPKILVSDATVTEANDGTLHAVFTVTIDRILESQSSAASVDYATGGFGYYTATAGADYTAKSGALSFGLGESSLEISVPILSDTTDEFDEEFAVNLFNSVGGIVWDSQAVGTILDNDAEPVLSINNIRQKEGDRRQTAFDFTVSLSGASDKYPSVSFSTQNGTAKANTDDYLQTYGSISFSPGETTRTLTVQVRGDKYDEPNETFFVKLVNAFNATIFQGRGRATIVNDDQGGPAVPPRILISNAYLSEGNGDTARMTFVVTLSQASDLGVWVDFRTINDSARTGDNDYVAKSETLFFAPGETTKTIWVAIKGDRRRESNERFFVQLSNAVHGDIDRGRGVGKILNDDIRG